MKKKSWMTISLSLIVAVVWGMVAFRLYDTFFGGNKTEEIKQEETVFGEVNLNSRTEFKLLANYSDPFLGKNYSKVFSSPVKKQSISKKNTQPEKKVDLSFIIYKGLIKNQMSKKQIALIGINGMEHLINEGETIQDVCFTKYYKDSVKVTYQRNKYIIKKTANQ